MGTKYKDKLEGGYRLLRIRRIKSWVFAALITLTFGLLTYRILASGASLKPFYLPVSSFFSLLLIMLLFGLAMNMAFRRMEILYVKRDSQRHLMAKNSMKGATYVIILSSILAVILLLPATVNVSRDAMTTTSRIALAPRETAVFNFTNQDSLGLTRVIDFEIAAENGPLSIVVMVNGNTNKVFRMTAGQTVDIQVNGDRYQEYEVAVTNPTTASFVSFTNRVVSSPMSELFTFLPGILIILVIMETAWLLYLKPIKERYAASSIYSIDFVQEVSGGEEVYRLVPARETFLAVEEIPSQKTGASVASVAKEPAIPEPPPPKRRPPPMPLAPEELKAQREQVENLISVGTSLYTSGKYEEASVFFDRALAVDPRNLHALHSRANTLMKLGKISEAKQTFDNIISIDKRDYRALRTKAQLLEVEKLWSEALETYDSYLALKPEDAEIVAKKAEVLLQLGRKADAFKAFQWALALSPGNPEIIGMMGKVDVDVSELLSKAMIASASGDSARAVEAFDLALAVQPDNVSAHLGKAVALRRMDRKPEAMKAIEAVLSRDPTNPVAHLNRGMILAESGEFKEALKAFDKALEANPGDADAWGGKGTAHAELGEEEKALESYREALKRRPGDTTLERKISELEWERGQIDELLKELFNIRGIGPSKAKALIEAGFRSRKDFMKASVKQLLEVRGITQKIAQDIVHHFQRKEQEILAR